MGTASGPAIIPVDGGEEIMITDISDSVRAVEQLLKYKFKNQMLLEDALTHPSYTESASYQRLEFIGDAALGCMFANYVFLAFPDLEPGDLSLIRAANISTEKLARAAVRHGLYQYVRHNAVGLDEKVRNFVLAAQREGETVVYGGAVKAPKVLADIFESVAGAVYVDLNFNLEALWVKIRGLLEPIITLDMLQKQPQPVTMLIELCQKDGKKVDFAHWRRGEKNIASVYVDGEFVVSCSSEQKDHAKLHAARAALEKLSYPGSSTEMNVDIFNVVSGSCELDGAKQKLHELCGKKRWPKPTYRYILN